MNRNASNDRTPLAAIGPQAYELTYAELDRVSGGAAQNSNQGHEIQTNLENVILVASR